MTGFIEEKEEVRVQVEIVDALFSPLGRGDVLEWSTIEQALSLDRESNRFRHVVSRARRWLQNERKIETWVKTGVGVQLLTHKEQVSFVPKKRNQRASRQHGKALKSIENTDLDELTMRDRMIAMAYREKSVDARKSAREMNKIASSNVNSDRGPMVERALSELGENVVGE